MSDNVDVVDEVKEIAKEMMIIEKIKKITTDYHYELWKLESLLKQPIDPKQKII